MIEIDGSPVHFAPSAGDKDVIDRVIVRVQEMVKRARAGDLKSVEKALRNHDETVRAGSATIPPCAACEAYRRPSSTAPYKMYHLEGAPATWLDCIHCPVGVVLGECSMEGSAWRGLLWAARAGDGRSFTGRATAALRKLERASRRW